MWGTRHPLKTEISLPAEYFYRQRAQVLRPAQPPKTTAYGMLVHALT
jgi:hypothetical protein